MSLENPIWGATKIHGELLKLGIQVAQSTGSGRAPLWRSAAGLRVNVTSIASKRRNPFDASRCGDEMMRTTLYEAVLLRSAKWSWLKGLGDEDCLLRHDALAAEFASVH